jgi:nucleoside-diphosphate-sugar epimerase
LIPSDPYSVEKLASEQVVLENGGQVLRLSNVFGHHPRYRGTITEDLKIQCHSEMVTELSLRSYDAVLDFIDVASVVCLIRSALQSRGSGVVNVASGQSVALLELLALASEVSKKPIAAGAPKGAVPRVVQKIDITSTVAVFKWQPPPIIEMLKSYFSSPQ